MCRFNKYNLIVNVYFHVLIIFVFTSPPPPHRCASDEVSTVSTVSLTTASSPSQYSSNERWINALIESMDLLNNDLFNITDPMERHELLHTFWSTVKQIDSFRNSLIIQQTFTTSILKNQFNVFKMQTIKRSIYEWNAVFYFDIIRSALINGFIIFPTQYNERIILTMFEADPIGIRILEYFALLGVHTTEVLNETSIRIDDEFALSFIDKINGIQSSDEYRTNADEYEIYLHILINAFPESMTGEKLNLVSAIVNAADNVSLHEITHTHTHRRSNATETFDFYKYQLVNSIEMKLWLFEFVDDTTTTATDKIFYLKDILHKDYMMVNDDVVDGGGGGNDITTANNNVIKVNKQRTVEWQLKDNHNLNAFKWKLEMQPEYKKCFFKNMKYDNEVLAMTAGNSYDDNFTIYTISRDELTNSTLQYALWYTRYCQAD